jgi:hypothetical protein
MRFPFRLEHHDLRSSGVDVVRSMSAEERSLRRVTRGAVARPDSKVPNYNEDDSEDEPYITEPVVPRKRSSTSSVAAAPRGRFAYQKHANIRPKRARNDIWTPEYLLTNPKSKLVQCELSVFQNVDC